LGRRCRGLLRRRLRVLDDRKKAVDRPGHERERLLRDLGIGHREIRDLRPHPLALEDHGRRGACGRHDGVFLVVVVIALERIKLRLERRHGGRHGGFEVLAVRGRLALQDEF
jgi:hypothetical protein